jgi:hypothetical protein
MRCKYVIVVKSLEAHGLVMAVSVSLVLQSLWSADGNVVPRECYSTPASSAGLSNTDSIIRVKLLAERGKRFDYTRSAKHIIAN